MLFISKFNNHRLQESLLLGPKRSVFALAPWDWVLWPAVQLGLANSLPEPCNNQVPLQRIPLTAALIAGAGPAHVG